MNSNIDRIKLPNGRSLSRMAYGVWRLSEAQDHSVSANLARIDACLAQGITTFDHADIYGDYRCEALFGEAIKARPSLKSQIEIVTKTDIMLLSSQWPSTRVKHYDTSAAHVTASVERSLSRIGVDVIDLLLIHRPDPLMDAQALGNCLDNLIDSGKLRGVGVSNFMPWDVDLLQSCMKHKLQTELVAHGPLYQWAIGARPAAPHASDGLVAAGGRPFACASGHPRDRRRPTRPQTGRVGTRIRHRHHRRGHGLADAPPRWCFAGYGQQPARPHRPLCRCGTGSHGPPDLVRTVRVGQWPRSALNIAPKRPHCF